MQVHSYGEIIWCREVIFENGKYDRLGRHPGIVILPTSENEEFAYCLCMTSDKKRANREKYKFVEHKLMPKKDSYINIQQIVKRVNIKDDIIKQMKQEEFIEVLEEFYNYQIKLKKPQEEFIKIENKVKTLIELLKINQKLNLESREIRYDDLEKYSAINDMKRIHRIYLTELLLRYNGLENEIKRKCFSEERERIYSKRLLELYGKLREVEYSKVNFDNPNNQIREIYINSKQNNYLINTDTLFYDAIELFKVTEDNPTYSVFIDKFMKHEEARQQEQKNKREQKSKAKIESRNKKKEENSKEKRDKKRASLVEKYGEFDWF